ncbi:MAG TPA: FG-GAP-like repeat-containing protein, partial [Armatimonadota bacterium]|nr:FG-GAP-like repeat-containing protein [Armatimonadota bacterium]
MSARTIRGSLLLFPMFLAGSACAQFAVSDSGTATYKYNLTLPPGVGGMTPSLSLSYAAGAGNGPLGYGWSLQGISAITRCPSTLATDGTSAAVRYAGSDKLCLDGQRLIQTDSSGTPLAANLQVGDALGLGANQYREYRTERDSYARIRAYGYANGDTTGAFGPAYFKVWYKSGQIAEFGASPNADANTNALITSVGTNTTISVPMVWAIARLSNAFGNNIDYKYEQRNVRWGSSTQSSGMPDIAREWALREIQYSGNKIIFNYLVDASGNDLRTDKSEIEPNNFVLPMKNVSTRLLKSINYYVNSPNTGSLGKAAGAVPVKNILLSYTNGPITGRSLIQKIQECVGEGATRCLPAPTFSYTQGSNDAYYPNATFSASPLATTVLRSGDGNSTFVIPIDVNGDGKTDLLAVNWTASTWTGSNWTASTSSNKLYLSQGNGSFAQVPSGTGAGQFNLSSVNLSSANGCSQAYIVDINGDGLPDILVIGNSCSGGTDTAYINKGDGSFAPSPVTGVTLKRSQQQMIRDSSGSPLGLSYGMNYNFLDVNGDGKVDVVVTEAAGPLFAGGPTQSCSVSNCTSIYYGDGTGKFTNASYTGNGMFSQTDPLDPAVGDMDGDGVDDLSVFVRDGSDGVSSKAISVARSRGDGTFESLGTSDLLGSLTGIPAGAYLTGFISSAGSCRSGGFIDYNGGGKRGCLSGSDTQGANTLSGLTNFNINGANDILGSKDGTIGVDIFDANGDGRQDILRWHSDATKNALYLSNGDGTFRLSSTFNLGGATPIQLRNANFGYVLGDFTGHGAVEILRLASSPSAGTATSNLLLTKSDATPPDLLNSVTSGMGVQTSVYYVPLSDANYGGINRYVDDARNPAYAVTNAQDKTPTMYVVARTISDAGVGASI